MAYFTVVDKFTSNTSDTYNNDSDFIQNIVLSGHTSYASLMNLADSDNNSSFNSIKDSCAVIIQTAVYSEFSSSDQTIVRTIDWPGDNADDSTYYNNYRETVMGLNANGIFREIKYVRRLLRLGLAPDSDGNNWGA